MLPFGGHHHGSSWINERIRAGLSESVSIMSLCIAGQDYRQQGRTGRRKRAEWRSQKVWAVLGRKYYDWRGGWKMSWAAGRHMSALRDVHVWEYTGKWMMHETQIVAAPLFLLWVAQKRLQWCLLRTLRFWEIVAFPFCSHHHNLPLSSPPPGRKIKHSRFMRRRKKTWLVKSSACLFLM